MKFVRKTRNLLSTVILISLLSILTACGGDKIVIDTDEPPIKIGWSDWAGWAPWEVVGQKNLIEENGGNAETIYFKGYSESLDALKNGEVTALSVTINDALVLKESIDDLQIILVNDVSDGGDGLLVKNDVNINEIKDLKGRIVSLEENSVSHYLFLRALEENDVDPSTIQINNISANLAGEAFLGSAFLEDKFTQAVVTWNPHLSIAKKQGKGKVLFDSSQIYGEITDVLVAKKSNITLREADFQAVVNAWYDAMELLDSDKSRGDAIEIMAKKSGMPAEDFENLLVDVEIFTKARKTVEFMGTDGNGKLLTFVNRVEQFLLSQGVLTEDLYLDDFVNPALVIKYYNTH